MFSIEELNSKVQKLGLKKIHYIAETDNGTDWHCYIEPECLNAYKLFGFDPDTLTFEKDVNEVYESYSIEESAEFKGTYDIVFTYVHKQ